ncbi:MAG: adventurous gliding motility protein CglE [Myxococcota bacterium]
MRRHNKNSRGKFANRGSDNKESGEHIGIRIDSNREMDRTVVVKSRVRERRYGDISIYKRINNFLKNCLRKARLVSESVLYDGSDSKSRELYNSSAFPVLMKKPFSIIIHFLIGVFMIGRNVLFLIIISLFSFSLFAQTETTATSAYKVKKITEVHKGIFVNTDLAYGLSIMSDVSGLSSGFTNSMTVGYDIMDILSVEAGFYSFFISADNSTGYAYGYGYNKEGKMVYFDANKCKKEFGDNIDVDKCAENYPKYLSNDVAIKLIGLSAKFAYLSTDRLFAYVRAGGGFAFLSPDKNYKSDGSELSMSGTSPAFDGGVGAEYYTTLRHFSIAIEARAYYFLGIGTLFLNLQPSIKYTF